VAALLVVADDHSESPVVSARCYFLQFQVPPVTKRIRALICLAWYTNHFKALRHGSQSFTCNKHHTCLYLVSVHQMAPPPIEVADI